MAESDVGDVIEEHISEKGLLSEFATPDDFIMAFSVVNSMSVSGEGYKDTISYSCIQALRFLNSYASRIQVRKEDVANVLTEFKLAEEIVPKVVDAVIHLSREYRSLVDSFIQSLAMRHVIDFNWSMRMIMFDSTTSRQNVLVVRLSLAIQDRDHNTATVVLELDQAQLRTLLKMFDSIDECLGVINVNL